mmetsp:Transcript_117871/g.334225  ORF Transcript_117871/g.334225 Transcript_117871/m.334225 type:complete len:203 (-) Transcript_117871:528-1136(-)
MPDMTASASFFSFLEALRASSLILSFSFFRSSLMASSGTARARRLSAASAQALASAFALVSAGWPSWLTTMSVGVPSSGAKLTLLTQPPSTSTCWNASSPLVMFLSRIRQIMWISAPLGSSSRSGAHFCFFAGGSSGSAWWTIAAGWKPRATSFSMAGYSCATADLAASCSAAFFEGAGSPWYIGGAGRPGSASTYKASVLA